MGSSTQTPTLDLPIFADNDRPTWRGDINDAFNKIDAQASSVNSGLTNRYTKAEVDALLAVKQVKDADVVLARDHGVLLNGSVDDTTAVNNLISAFPGRDIKFTQNPAGNATLLINAIANAGAGGQQVGIMLNRVGTRLIFENGVVVKAIPNGSDHYSIIQVTAADCALLGGIILGDVDTHTTTTGEWGHGVDIQPGADRFVAQYTKATKCWGDGFIVYGGAGGRLLSVVSDNNRRQGCSVINATRFRIIGGEFINTGVTKWTGPGAGIDIEPNAGSANNVDDILILGVTATGNIGSGFLASSNGQRITGIIDCCLADGNGNGTTKVSGFTFAGATNKIRVKSCTALNNYLDGFLFDSTTVGLKAVACDAEGNLRFGFTNQGTRIKFKTCSADFNMQTGFYFDPAAVTPRAIGCTAEGNSQQATATYQNFDMQCPDGRLISCFSDAGTQANKPNYGFLTRSTGLRARYIGCDASGAFAGGFVNDQSNTAQYEPPIGVPVGATTVVAGAQNGAVPPAPTVTLASRNNAGNVKFGSGTGPSAGMQVVVTYSAAYVVAPVVTLIAKNAATQALGLYPSITGTGSFTVGSSAAPAASQAGVTYEFDYLVR